MGRRFASARFPMAMAAVMLAVPIAARAQSFNAAGTVVAGAGAITTGLGTTTIAADTPSLVINWSPHDSATGGGPINFQPAGTSALFTNRAATTLTVLNRIIPADVTRPVVFSGTVASRLVDPGTGAVRRGGTLFFYSPGGILVSASGRFNVGNLALTTSDPAFDAVTGLVGTSTDNNFLPAKAASQGEGQSGAQIAAGPLNASAALAAPKVARPGTVNADGSAVVVAVDASTITFRPDALYDIQIDQGTREAGGGASNDGAHDGFGTGAITGLGGAPRVAMAAVSRNEAITMAIKGGAELGFEVAGAANVDGNAVVLSAGSDLTAALIDAIRLRAASAARAFAIKMASPRLGESVDRAAHPANPCLPGAAATDDGAFISVGGIGSTLDVAGNRQIVGPDQALEAAVSANPASAPGASTGPDEPNAEQHADAASGPCRP
ncbi:MAG: hypothetical protein K2X68_13900 [Novosphingobium sp.]|nr:hypothetical protein [Novosphingobium sp.]